MSHVTVNPTHEWQPFRCAVVPQRDLVRLEPAGELDLAATAEVEGPLNDLLAAGFRTLVLDLAGLTFIDSAGLRMVVQARETAAREGAALTVLPGPPSVQRCFELACLSDVVFS